MKQCRPFYIVNVFADIPFGGNPLAVFDYADDLTDKQMLAITRQFNLSETVFICHHQNSIPTLRIFSPMGEMSFAGHPTLGAASILYLYHDSTNEFVIQTAAKPINISVYDDIYSFFLGNTHTQGLICDDFVKILHLSPHHIKRANIADCGIRQLLVEVTDRTILAQVKVDLLKLRHLCQIHHTPDVFVYVWCVCNDKIYARSFFEQDGAIIQDAGTGSACANMGAILADNQQYGNYVVYQGDDIDKPCRLSLLVRHHQIQVGGRVHLMGQGEFYL